MSLRDKVPTQALGTLGAGGTAAIVLLFLVEYFLPGMYLAMDDLQKQAFTLLVLGLVQDLWRRYGSRAPTPPPPWEPGDPAEE